MHLFFVAKMSTKCFSIYSLTQLPTNVFQMFIFCALGYRSKYSNNFRPIRSSNCYFSLSFKNDTLKFTLQQMNHHLLTIALRRDFKFVFQILQNVRYLKVGNAIKLDVELFVLVGVRFLLTR